MPSLKVFLINYPVLSFVIPRHYMDEIQRKWLHTTNQTILFLFHTLYFNNTRKKDTLFQTSISTSTFTTWDPHPRLIFQYLLWFSANIYNFGDNLKPHLSFISKGVNFFLRGLFQVKPEELQLLKLDQKLTFKIRPKNAWEDCQNTRSKDEMLGIN